MKNLRNLVNRNLLAVFAAATILFPVVASSNDTPFKKDPLIKEEKSFAVTTEPEFLSRNGKAFTVTRFYDSEKRVTCYMTSSGSISCLQLGETPLSGFRQNLEDVKERAVENPTPENIKAYKKLEEESKRKALEFTLATQRCGMCQ